MLAASLLAVLVSQAAGQSPARPSDAGLAERSRAGKELMAAGRYAEAAAAYRELVRAMPGNAGLLVNLGMALHLSGKDAEAIPPLESAVRLDPASLPANLFLGAARLRTGRAEAAVVPLQKAVRLQPDNLEARSMLAEALMGLERPGQAEPHLRRITQLARPIPRRGSTWGRPTRTWPAAPSTVSWRRTRNRRSRSPSSAKCAWTRAGARRPSSSTAAVERAPTMRGLHAALARIYKETGHADWAAIEQERERRLGAPDCTRASLACTFLAGEVSRRSSPPRWTRRAWKRPIGGPGLQRAGRRVVRPSHVAASLRHSYEWQAETARSQRRFRNRSLLAQGPRAGLARSRLLTELGVTLRMNRDLAEAERVLGEAVRPTPRRPRRTSCSGTVLLAREQPARALPYLEKAVRADPQAPTPRVRLGAPTPSWAGPRTRSLTEESLESDTDGSLRLQLGGRIRPRARPELARRP
jgi:Flp pilus assembly protein TadD